MKKQNPLNYAFAIGKIRSLEKFLIKKEVFEETIEAEFNESLRLFVEADLYGDEFLRIKDSLDLEEALDKELLKIKELIRELLLDKELIYLIEISDLKKAKETCDRFDSQFLKDYISHLIDAHNIKTFLRIYTLKEKKEKLEGFLIEGGFVGRKAFLNLYEQDLSIFLTRMEYVRKREQFIDYASFLKAPIEKLEKENSFLYLEKALNDFLIEIIKTAKYISFGPEPLIAYYFAKVNEINLIRMIVLAKLNELPRESIKERLNSVYA